MLSFIAALGSVSAVAPAVAGAMTDAADDADAEAAVDVVDVIASPADSTLELRAAGTSR